MLLIIDHHSGVPIYRQIVDQVREQILTGILRQGEQLMSVRELSAKLAVNPMTVSKAYSAMEAEGLLERRKGIGLFIADDHADQKEKNKESAVETHLTKAVTMAMQFDLSREKLQKMLNDLFSKFQSENKRVKNE
jgi:GntR family transcriptional regulator